MEQKPYKPSSEALAAYFAGECTPEEQLSIEGWVANSEANHEEFEQLRTIWKDLGALRPTKVKVDVKSGFQQVKKKKEQLNRRTLWPILGNIAAAILMLITVTWLLWKPAPEPVVTVAASVKQINLADGSLVTLNESAVLTYPEQFDPEVRRMELVGEAFFSVEPDRSRPFQVQTQGVTITVLGTEFNVNAGEEAVVVSVSSGRVEVRTDFALEVLKAGDRMVVNLNDETATKGNNSNSGTELFWMSKRLQFEGVRLSEVLADLKSVYQLDIEVSNEAILNCRLQATFEGQSIEEVLEIIALSQNLEVTESSGTYLLAGEGCIN